MAIYKRGKVYWYKFTFGGELIRASTKQGNQRVAEQIEAARKTQLAKGEVGIEDQKPCPTLGQFAEKEFLPDVERKKKDKPRTVRFYQDRVARLRTFPRLWNARLDRIEQEDITAFIASRQNLELATSTVNRDLATLRRMFRLAVEWKRVRSALPQVKLLPGEAQRERVISRDEQSRYLAAAAPLLRDFATLALDCGLRPEEAYRLKWSQIRNGNVEIHTGKTKDARRSIPASPAVVDMFSSRRANASGDWVFPAPTITAHIDVSSIRKQHLAALKAAKLEHFVIYALRHTCLTRWAESGMDPFTLKKLAGHANLSTTMRYVHMSDDRARAAMEKVWSAPGGHRIGHRSKKTAQREMRRRSISG